MESNRFSHTRALLDREIEELERRVRELKSERAELTPTNGKAAEKLHVLTPEAKPPKDGKLTIKEAVDKVLSQGFVGSCADILPKVNDLPVRYKTTADVLRSTLYTQSASMHWKRVGKGRDVRWSKPKPASVPAGEASP